MLTASTEDGAVIEAIVAGATGFVQKYSDSDELVDTLRQVAEGRLMIPDDAVRAGLQAVARRDCTDARAEGTDGTSKGGKTCLSLSQHSPSGVIIRLGRPSKRRTYPYERRWTSTSGPKFEIFLQGLLHERHQSRR